LDGVERADRKIQSGVKPPQSKKLGSGLNFLKMITFAASRATSERSGENAGQNIRIMGLTPTTGLCGNEGVLECSGLTELWMVSSALIEKSKAVSSHRSPKNKDPA
jgi:hypothetical protein